MKEASKSASPAAWANRIVGRADVSPAELVANARNWRTHPEAQKRALAGALTEVGWVAPLIVNKRSGQLVDGHARLDLALARKEPTVPVVYVDLSPEEEAVVLASLDPLAAMAGKNQDKLDELLRGMTVNNAELAAMFGSMKTAEFKPLEGEGGVVSKPERKINVELTCPECGHVFRG